MSIKKQYSKSKPLCKVSFSLSDEMVAPSKAVTLVGEFNNWDLVNLPLKKNAKDGSYSVTIELETGKEYQFRYLLDGVKWENDPSADKYLPTIFGDCDNSVVVV